MKKIIVSLGNQEFVFDSNSQSKSEPSFLTIVERGFMLGNCVEQIHHEPRGFLPKFENFTPASEDFEDCKSKEVFESIVYQDKKGKKRLEIYCHDLGVSIQ